MNTTSLTTTIRLHRPWFARASEAAGATWSRARAALSGAYARWAERVDQENALELDEATLRDMGAPLWLIEEARVRREARSFDRGLQHIADWPRFERYY